MKFIVKTLLIFKPLNFIARHTLELIGYSTLSKRVKLLSYPLENVISFSSNKENGVTFDMISSADGKTDQIVLHNYLNGWSAFEKPLPSVISILCSANNSFLDVGANTGYYSIIAAKSGAENVYSVEPYEPVFKSLVENVELNALKNKISVFPIALDDSSTTKQLFIPTQEHGSIETSASLSKSFKADHSSSITINTQTLDQFALDEGINQIDLIKIDVESMEINVLDGASKTIETNRPIIILEILTEKDKPLFLTFLNTNNYVSYSIGKHVFENQELTINPETPNFIFCPQEKAVNLESLLSCHISNN